MSNSARLYAFTDGPATGIPRRCVVNGAAGDNAELLDAYSHAVTAVVEAIGPAVVSIRAARRTPQGMDLAGSGSGVVIAPDGYILTNSHVVHGARPLTVSFTDGDQCAAELVGDDPATDLAVIRAQATGLCYAGFGESGALRAGQLVIAMGNPFGFESSVSTGVVGALGRNLRAQQGQLIENVIQHTAPLNPGNSGGPLLDTRGRIVGINTAIIAMAQGIGFAIPADTAKWVFVQLLRHAKVRRGYLGLVGRDRPLSRRQIRLLALDQDRAVEVMELDTEGPAAQAGLHTGDLIVGVDDGPVRSVDDLHRILAADWQQGMQLTLDVVRLAGDDHKLKLAVLPTER